MNGSSEKRHKEQKITESGEYNAAWIVSFGKPT